MNKLIIIGASGHGKVIADIAIRNGYEDIAFLDDNLDLTECSGFPVVGATNNANKYTDCDIIVAIGDAGIRERIQRSLDGYSIATLIHPDAVISRRVKIGKGTVVMAGAVINSDSAVGEGCIINTCASVDHDNSIGDFVHVAVGAHLCGTVEIGNRTWIGAGATVSNNITICSECVIGVGAVVVNNLSIKGTYLGVPARNVADKQE
ncbi:MAG: acetyltransferase [Ruminococcus sp.]|nr:acetyltransferase [Ruminococcus sp.]